MKHVFVLLLLTQVAWGYIPPGLIDPTYMPSSTNPYFALPETLAQKATYPTYKDPVASALEKAEAKAAATRDAYDAQGGRMAGILDGIDQLETDPESFDAVCQEFAYARDSLKVAEDYMKGDSNLADWIFWASVCYNLCTNDTDAAYYANLVYGYCDSRNSGNEIAMDYINSASGLFDTTEGMLPE
jgi:hypothetical protein